MKIYQWSSVFLSVVLSVLLCSPALAAEKTWSGAGDAASWADDDNWYPAVAPTQLDDISVDEESATVTCDRTFYAKSLTLGGRNTSTVTVDDFVYGSIEPDSSSDIAILNRAYATLTLKGAGILTVKGTYKDSEESLTREPSFIFWLE